MKEKLEFQKFLRIKIRLQATYVEIRIYRFELNFTNKKNTNLKST